MEATTDRGQREADRLAKIQARLAQRLAGCENIDAVAERIREHDTIACLADLVESAGGYERIRATFPAFGGEPLKPVTVPVPAAGSHIDFPLYSVPLSWDESRVLELQLQDFRLGVEARLLVMRSRAGGEVSVLI